MLLSGLQKRKPIKPLIIEANDEDSDDLDLDSEMGSFAFVQI
jgi:hypothetical protein